MDRTRAFTGRDGFSRRKFLGTVAGGGAAALVGAPFVVRAAPTGEVPLGFLGDLTKAIGFFNSPRLIGLQSAYQYLTERENGIAGRKPVLKWYDHKSDPTEAVSGFSMLSGCQKDSCGRLRESAATRSSGLLRVRRAS